MKYDLTPVQLKALLHAAYKSTHGTAYGFLCARVDDGERRTSPKGPRWRATCCCGAVLMQPIDGRACIGLLRREFIRRGREESFNGETWDRFVVTPEGAVALSKVKTRSLR